MNGIGLFGEYEDGIHKEPVPEGMRDCPRLGMTAVVLRDAAQRGIDTPAGEPNEDADSVYAAIAVGCWTLTRDNARRIAVAMAEMFEEEVRNSPHGGDFVFDHCRARKIPCEITNITLKDDKKADTPSVGATCSKCGTESVAMGRSAASVRECLVRMRHNCPNEENNFYVASGGRKSAKQSV